MERLGAARRLPENQDPTKQFAIEHAEKMLVDAGVKDPGTLVATSVEKPTPKIGEQSQDKVGKVVVEYNSQPLTPELVNKTWQTLWTEWGKRVGQTFEIPQCDRTSEELAQLKKENKAVLLIPDNVDLIMLGKIFPQMQSRAVSEGTTVTESSKGGSIDTEMDLDSPNRDTTEFQAKDFLKQNGRNGQRLRTYIIGSQLSKLLTGHYFDENAYSRLPGSRNEARMVLAHFHSDGGLHVRWHLGPLHHDPDMGFRSEGVRKA